MTFEGLSFDLVRKKKKKKRRENKFFDLGHAVHSILLQES